MHERWWLLGFSCVADDNGAGVMMVMRSLLCHFKHVSGVWSDVLPTNIYLRSVGEFITCILQCESKKSPPPQSAVF